MKALTAAELKHALSEMKKQEGGRFNGPLVYRACILKSVSENVMTVHEALKRLFNMGFRGRYLDLTQ